VCVCVTTQPIGENHRRHLRCREDAPRRSVPPTPVRLHHLYSCYDHARSHADWDAELKSITGELKAHTTAAVLAVTDDVKTHHTKFSELLTTTLKGMHLDPAVVLDTFVRMVNSNGFSLTPNTATRFEEAKAKLNDDLQREPKPAKDLVRTRMDLLRRSHDFAAEVLEELGSPETPLKSPEPQRPHRSESSSSQPPFAASTEPINAIRAIDFNEAAEPPHAVVSAHVSLPTSTPVLVDPSSRSPPAAVSAGRREETSASVVASSPGLSSIRSASANAHELRLREL
jgi:hypothetical protein